MKNTLRITGGKPLQGTIDVQGAKNEALQIIPSTILYQGEVLIDNIPDILDIRELINILIILGAKVERKNTNCYLFDTTNVDPAKMQTPEFREASSKLRGSLMVAGAMLGRFGVAYMPTPGGDKIGIRSVNPHLKAFQDFGAVSSMRGDLYSISLNQTSVTPGKIITLSEASVTGTANILLASVFYRQGTIVPSFQIYNAACEPYIQKLCQLLNSYGAKISGIGSNLLSIEPVDLSSIDTSETKHHIVSPDMIELGSLIVLSVVAGVGVEIKCPKPFEVLGATAEGLFPKLGVLCIERSNSLWVPHHPVFTIQKPTTPGKTVRRIYDDKWPGLSPDHISSLVTLAVFADGPLEIEQRMFEQRLNFTDPLKSMGAELTKATDKLVLVYGNGRKQKLRSMDISSPDIRAGMALLIAALAAEGTSTIHNASQIHRGYENIVERLRGLGAQIEELD